MKSLILSFCLWSLLYGQNLQIPSYYDENKNLSNKLKAIVVSLDLDKDFDVGEDGMEQISLAVIKLDENKPLIAGVNMDNFIYPASVYKMYVAAEVLNQVYSGHIELTTLHVVKAHNAVDKSKEIKSDPRPLLKENDSVTVNYLLDLMITRSDNSAANCLIDIAGRENINKLMKDNGWEGSEVTRKFLKRKFEDPGYDTVRSTVTCALHAADFMYKIETEQLVNPWVSRKMKTYLGNQLDKNKLAQGLPNSALYYHKTGWFSYWTNDVGIVEDGNIKYIVACFIPVEEDIIKPKFKELGKRIHELLAK